MKELYRFITILLILLYAFDFVVLANVILIAIVINIILEKTIDNSK